MAIHAHSTTAPAFQPRLLPFTFRPSPPVDDPRSAEELLEEIRRTIEGQLDRPELPPEPLLPTADLALALRMRRELHQALDHGFALLDALDLPPMALDVIDDAIATLDALDASDEDREEGGDSEASLGWTAAGACSGYDFDDREHDTADAELSCGWTAKVNQVHLGSPQDDHETTALERHGKGFIRSGPDDAEDDDRESVNEDGDDCGEADKPWWDRIGYPVMEVAHV